MHYYLVCFLLVFTAFSALPESASQVLLLLGPLLDLPGTQLLPFADGLVSSLPCLLRDGVPLRVLELSKRVWFKLHSIMPRQ
jgi:hypothetical protein